MGPMFCYCQRPHPEAEMMVECDSCSEWYHIACLNITKYDVSKVKNFLCPVCATKQRVPFRFRTKAPNRKVQSNHL